MSINLKPYLVDSHVINWRNQSVLAKAREFKGTAGNELNLVETTFKYVRDGISHINDVRASNIACKASEVLAEKNGYCYAKSHLLAALLRANGVPSGFSYQRLYLGNDRFCLHGLNSVYLTDFGWHKIDARGNNKNISTYFKPPEVSLAFRVESLGEQNSTKVYDSPLGVVIDALESASGVEEMDRNLPDLRLT